LEPFGFSPYSTKPGWIIIETPINKEAIEHYKKIAYYLEKGKSFYS